MTTEQQPIAIAVVTTAAATTKRGTESTIQWLRDPLAEGSFLYDTLPTETTAAEPQVPLADWTIARDAEGILAIAPNRHYFHVRDGDLTLLPSALRQLCVALRPDLPAPAVITEGDDTAVEGVINGVTFAPFDAFGTLRASVRGIVHFPQKLTTGGWGIGPNSFLSLVHVAEYINTQLSPAA